MQEGQYFAAHSPEEIEWERAGLIKEFCDATTTRRLEALGVESGWRCTDVGAGRGSIALWLADRVGPSGQVVAADLNTSLLKRAQLPPNVQVREHNILTQDLDRERYDLVLCRALLMHLSEPELALGRMAAAVRPGGWLFIEEFDFSSFCAVDFQYPGAEVFERTTRAFWEALSTAGNLDCYFGRRIPAILDGLSFVNTGTAGQVLIGRGGDHPLGKFWSLTFQLPGFEALVERGITTREEFDRTRSLFEDASFRFVATIQFGAWGRRPSNIS
jgi:SAM-dependent methyltransferase